METLDITLIICIILAGSFLIRKHLKEVDNHKNKVINDVLLGNTQIEVLKTNNLPKDFLVTYRDKYKGSLKVTIKATNSTEAEAIFCKENGIPTLRIISVNDKK